MAAGVLAGWNIANYSSMSANPNRLQIFLNAISRDQWTAIEGLAVVTTLRATHEVCTHTWGSNGFLAAVHDTAAQSTLMALGRLLDEDKRAESVTIIGVCDYAEQNSSECGWLFSSAGRHAYRDGEEELKRRCNYWKDWVRSLTVRETLKALRDKTLAHRDKPHVLGEIELKTPMLDEIRNTVRQIGGFVNSFTELTDNSETADWHLYDQILEDGTQTLCVGEAMWLDLIERSHEGLWKQRVSPLVDQVKTVITRLEEDAS